MSRTSRAISLDASFESLIVVLRVARSEGADTGAYAIEFLNTVPSTTLARPASTLIFHLGAPLCRRAIAEK